MLQVMKLGCSLNPSAVTLFPCCLIQCSVCAWSLSSIWRSWPSLFLYFSPVLGGVFLFCFHTNLVRSPIYYTLPVFVHLTVIVFRILSYSLLFPLNILSLGNIISSHGFNYQLFPIVSIMPWYNSKHLNQVSLKYFLEYPSLLAEFSDKFQGGSLFHASLSIISFNKSENDQIS